MKWMLTIVALLAAYFWLGRSTSVGQLNADSSYGYPGYEITTLETFRLSARVLSKRSYSGGREADLSPVDLAVGWGAMAEAENIDQIELSQRNRWMYWNAQKMPVPRRQLESSMANIHIIPANVAVAELLDNLPVGVMVALEGELVEVRGADGWRWRSSLSRTDTGAKSCELLLLRKVVLAEALY